MGILQNKRFNSVGLVLLVSGVFGFCVSVFGYASWQDALEPAQVIAGIVSYPAGNPMYLHCVKGWTIIHQVCALLLRLGFSERSLSFLLSGLLGMLSYQALAVAVLSISENTLFSILAPFFIQATALFSGAITYPIELMGSSRTYGICGLAYILLLAGLIALKRYKLGGLLLGLSIAIHPAWGLWFTMVAMICFLWDIEYMRDFFKQAAKFLIIGYALTAISLVIQLFLVAQVHLPHIDPGLATKYLSAFINHWDHHRFKFPLSWLRFILVGFVMSFIWIFFWKKDLPHKSNFLLRAGFVSVILAGIFSIVYWFPIQNAPAGLLILMPSRFFNLIFLTFLALLLGILWRYKENYFCQLLFLILVVSGYPKEFYPFIFVILTVAVLMVLKNRKAALVIAASVLFAMGAALVLRFVLKTEPYVLARKFIAPALILVVWRFRGTLKGIFQNQVVLAVLRKIILAMLCLSIFALGKKAKYSLCDQTNNQLFAEAQKGKGLLLVSSSLELAQLRTRRPILLNSANLDTLLYTLESGPEMERILKEVYGVDLFCPPQETKRMGGLARESGKILWESRTAEQWKLIGRDFGVTNILAYADWKLHLPEIGRSSEFVLYSIPKD